MSPKAVAARCWLLVAALFGGASHARAHAPLPRALAVAPGDAAGVAARMPGFGWLVRAPGATDDTFAYASCPSAAASSSRACAPAR